MVSAGGAVTETGDLDKPWNSHSRVSNNVTEVIKQTYEHGSVCQFRYTTLIVEIQIAAEIIHFRHSECTE